MLGPIDRNSQPPLEGSRIDSAANARRGANPGQAPDESVGADGFWLQRARDAYSSGKDWFDVSVRKQVEANLAHWRNQHAPGSKYYSEVYQKKSRMFRPRTRAMSRRTEASTAVAFFATSDLVNVSPVNQSNKDQADAAEVHNQLLNFRLENTIPWFQTIIGGAQDANATGVVISKQYWEYRTRKIPMLEVYEAEDGSMQIEQSFDEKVEVDRPCVKLCPIENIILDPAANWVDPINSSPYLIEMDPTYVFEIMEKMQQINPRTGKPVYRQLERGIVAAAIQQDWDSIRRAREGERIDKYEADSYVNDYQTVWVHKMIVRVDGVDWTYDTLGTEVLLSDPEPLEDVYPHLEGRERPYRMGTLMIEAHKLYPMAPAELVRSMQEEINDLVNLRMDNVKLGLNKRYFVRRGAGVDVHTLIRNIPGSAVMMDNPGGDVKETQPQDVTASSYQEQDRLNAEFDEVSGTFSSSSVGSNRRLNETVGGMSMLSADASQVKEYEIRTLTETWVEGVLRQLVMLESYYETDEEVLAEVSARASMPVERVLEVLQQRVRTRVNVGFSSTAPERRIGKVMMAIEGIAKIAPQLLQGIDAAEVLKELFGAVGYRDGARFFPEQQGEDARIAQLQAKIQELEQIIQADQVKQQGAMQIAQINGEYRLAAMQLQVGVAAELGRMKMMIEAKKAQLAEVETQLAIEAADMDRRELYLQREALSHEIQESNREFMLRLRELTAKAANAGGPKTIGGTSTPGKGAYNLPGNDKAGVISRDNFGLIPQNAF